MVKKSNPYLKGIVDIEVIFFNEFCHEVISSRNSHEVITSFVMK